MTWAGRCAWRAYSEECEVFLGGVIGTLAFLLIFKYAFFFWTVPKGLAYGGKLTFNIQCLLNVYEM